MNNLTHSGEVFNSSYPRLKGIAQIPFNGRFEEGTTVEERIKSHLETHYKLKVYPHGIQALPPQQREDLKVRSDQTSKNIRYEPDFYVPIPNANDSFLVECKSQLSTTNTTNFSLNLDEYNAQCRKQNAGSQILYVFDTNEPNEILYAEWLKNLEELIEWQKDHKSLEYASCSRKQYGLICKYKLRHLDTVINELLSKFPKWGAS